MGTCGVRWRVTVGMTGIGHLKLRWDGIKWRAHAAKKAAR